jgi:acyl-[acyl-carrier-protein]-phospholipid O-acyltransferase/long-chain-fatty-acid--[acyl-carrier-protein] ligase
LTYRRVLAGADLLAEQAARLQLALNASAFSPNINATPVTVLSLWALGKVPAVLNFSTGIATMQACAQLAQLKQIITSRVSRESKT